MCKKKIIIIINKNIIYKIDYLIFELGDYSSSLLFDLLVQYIIQKDEIYTKNVVCSRKKSCSLLFFYEFFFAPTHHTLREPALGGGFFLREREKE